ncbi:hypothetical protein SAMN05444266_101623 [Chitinophaga jiangningensis]|uniref:Uncharacterized protein n=1 Tax=Chitinophaga jiangningensis TaxID=1419482 RepID=A0A1M6WHM1_9BACT|nr:hypothetical protein [Chitinophaga jiangningensis]SHK93025.1 hypothetical protein SAMN05444266_101623 [Chitinophaga jiangningensis]
MTNVKSAEQQFAEALTTERFPSVVPISESWYKVALIGLSFSSKNKIGLTSDQYRTLLKTPKEQLSLMQVAVLNNNLLDCNPADLGCHLEEYVILVEESELISDAFNQKAEALREMIMQDFARDKVLSTSQLAAQA